MTSPLDLEAIEGHVRFCEQRGITPLEASEQFHTPPVDIETFINSPRFMDKGPKPDGTPGVVFPPVMTELVALNTGEYVEGVFTGGIGSGKTTGALYTTAYQHYLLHCMREPHRRFGLDPASEIIIIFQNKTLALAKTVSFARYRAMIDTSPWFQRHAAFDRKLQKSKLVFPGRIEVVPATGAESAAIGQNVIGGVIDELNYMDIVEKSKRSAEEGTFDQATTIYNSIARRRKSRFMEQGALPGILCLVSSRRYPGQFTDTKEDERRDEIAKTGKSTIFLYDKRTWDIRPNSFSGVRFWVFKGDLSRRPRILEPGEEAKFRPEEIIDVPEEYSVDFRKDIINALREIAGVSTLASQPFFVNQELVSACFGRSDSVLNTAQADFTTTKLKILPSRFRNLNEPRFVHVDLGLTGDSAGVVCGYVRGFRRVIRDDVVETLPDIDIDFTLRVPPPPGDEIKFSKIRQLLYKLRDQGMNIQWVSYDSFQSRDSIQILKQKGFFAGLISVDKETMPYDVLKTAMYDGRVALPLHEHLLRELLQLERVPMKDRIDHPEHGSKDVADALCGCVYGLTMRRSIWLDHGIELFDMPVQLRETVVEADKEMKSVAKEDVEEDVLLDDVEDEAA